MMKQGKTKIAVAALVAGSIALPAGAASAGEKTERAVIGAILGGVAGAAISKDDTTGVLVGAAAGAALGAATAKDNKHYRHSYRATRPYARDTRYGRYDRYDYGRYDTGRYYGRSSYDRYSGYYR
jgi:hypothetical protein